jgi:hypothetical protein
VLTQPAYKNLEASGLRKVYPFRRQDIKEYEDSERTWRLTDRAPRFIQRIRKEETEALVNCK